VKNQELWKPTKFVFKNGRLCISKNKQEAAVCSRLVGQLTAEQYGEYIPQYCSGRLVDLGCGKVPLYEAYKKHITDNVCVDWANTYHDTNFLDAECDLAGVLPFGDQEFDTIILSDVLEHVPSPQLLCSEIARILRPSGIVLLNVPFMYWLHEQPYDYYRYTKFALERLLQDAGLRLVHMKALGGSADVLADFLAKHVVKLPLLGDSVALAIQWAAYTFGRTRLGARFRQKSAEMFPLAYFVVAEMHTATEC
jgi:SAM-dependent methyltransferase